MKHARSDYDHIQDPSGKIPADEPVFLLRASDMLAPNVVRHWALQAKANGCDPEIIAAAESHVQAMIDWQKSHGRKRPDMPPGAKKKTPFLQSDDYKNRSRAVPVNGEYTAEQAAYDPSLRLGPNGYFRPGS